MKKITFAIGQWWHKVGAECHRRKIIQRDKQLWEEADRRLQVREFGGKLYLCFDNIPVLQEESLVDTLGEIMMEARENYFNFHVYRMSGNLPEVHR